MSNFFPIHFYISCLSHMFCSHLKFTYCQDHTIGNKRVRLNRTLSTNQICDLQVSLLLCPIIMECITFHDYLFYYLWFFFILLEMFHKFGCTKAWARLYQALKKKHFPENPSQDRTRTRTRTRLLEKIPKRNGPVLPGTTVTVSFSDSCVQLFSI